MCPLHPPLRGFTPTNLNPIFDCMYIKIRGGGVAGVPLILGCACSKKIYIILLGDG